MNPYVNRSEILYRRFSTLAATYLARPGIVDDPTAQVPLENLYRLLEMFRYDAFSDSGHVGVLSSGPRSGPDDQDRDWHARIRRALLRALKVAYSGRPKEEAIDKVESALRGLVGRHTKTLGGGSEELRAQAKMFFDRFASELSRPSKHREVAENAEDPGSSEINTNVYRIPGA